MYGKVFGSCIFGIEGRMIEVEVDVSNGLPLFNIVGLPDSAVRESAERVRSALRNCSFTFPMERITVNLAPADLRKEGAAFDLAIAAGILLASGQIQLTHGERTLMIGELALDGTIRPVNGVLSMVHSAKAAGFEQIFLPVENIHEARLVKGIRLIPIAHLEHLSGAAAENNKNGAGSEKEGSYERIVNDINNSHHLISKSTKSSDELPDELPSNEDYADVRGQYQAKRALLLCAAGLHNLLFIGPPGSGKTMLIRRLPTILPPLTDEEAMDVMKIYSVAGMLSNRGQLIRKRPFRSPHHTISTAGMIGGGPIPKPGEISLAHRGVLFLDELPEFQRGTLEVLRQPLEEKRVTIGRARGTYMFPTHFILAASMNPCPCGYWGSASDAHSCTCSPMKAMSYRAKISGPLLDRIDMQLEVPRVDYAQYTSLQSGLSSSEMKEMVLDARQRQLTRYKDTGIRCNGELTGKMLREHCALESDASKLLADAFELLGMSARAYDRILKLARTIADVEGAERISAAHIAEALQYRSLDKDLLKTS